MLKGESPRRLPDLLLDDKTKPNSVLSWLYKCQKKEETNVFTYKVSWVVNVKLWRIWINLVALEDHTPTDELNNETELNSFALSSELWQFLVNYGDSRHM